MPVMLMCVILFMLLFKYRLNSITKQEKLQEENYLQTEKAASISTEKSLEDLNFISIPLERFRFHISNDTKLSQIEEEIQKLSVEKICNLNGISNTDLKLKYGAKNLSQLSEYDHNYLVLVRTLAEWSTRLFELGYDDDAIAVAEYAIDCNSDVSKTYTTLARIYKKNGQMDKLYDLIPLVETLSTPIDLKKAIYDVLNEY